MSQRIYKVLFEENGQLRNKVAFKEGVNGILTIGKNGQQVDVGFDDPQISRQHAQLIFDGRDLFIQDLGSSNGTFFNDRKLDEGQSVRLAINDTVKLAGSGKASIRVVRPEEKTSAVTSDNRKSTAEQQSLLETDVTSLFKKQNSIVIGRLGDCDVTLNHPMVSRRHAQIERLADGRYKVKDLGSANGTYVNGKRISAQLVTERDRIMVGRFVIPLKGVVRDISREVAIDAEGITKVYPNGYVGLNETTISVPSHSLLAIMGPSGCGKSTLMKALNGDSPPTHGRVNLFGLELISNYEYLKTQIGYVPQDDIVHRELTVYQSLYYAAKLRLENASDDRIEAKIDQLLSELNIGHVRNNLVSKISGGQRKRVSIAVELLTDPMILFLDEPTSPLDPQTIEEFLGILKRLAEKGTTVVMVTHKPEDLDYMDSVIFMAEGGHLVYHGEADRYKNYFGVGTAVEVYANIAGDRSSKWVEKYQKSHPGSSSRQTNNDAVDPGNTDLLKQYYWLTARYLKIKTNDQVNTAIMILQAPIIAALICLIFEDVTQSVPFLMTISALWFGANNAAREIVKELPVYKRERMFNVRLVPYVLSKVTVLTLFAAIQSTLFVGIIYAYYQGTSQPWNDPLMSIVWMVCITGSATLMGLMLSAALDNTEKVMSLVPITLIPQIMLAGIVAKITSPLVEYISYLTLSRWGTEGMSNIQGEVLAEQPKANVTETGEVEMQTEKVAVNAVESLQQQFHEGYTDTFSSNAGSLQLDLIALIVLSVMFFSGILYFLKKKDSILRS